MSTGTTGLTLLRMDKCEKNRAQSDKHVKINLIGITQEGGREKGRLWEAISQLRKEVRASRIENKTPECKRSCRWNDMGTTGTNSEAQSSDSAGSGTHQAMGSIVTSRKSSLGWEGSRQSSKNKPGERGREESAV